MHDEEHDPLKAAEDGEKVGHGDGALLKLETAKDPHGAQHAQLSHCSDGERPAGGDKDTHLSHLRLLDRKQLAKR